MEYNNLKRSNPTHNLQNAFNVAEQKLGVTKLLDPEGERLIHPQLNAYELLTGGKKIFKDVSLYLVSSFVV